MTATHVTALRDHLVAAVRTLQTATTQEVIAEVYGADGKAHPYRYYSRVYSNLRALANQDRITWNSWQPDQPTTTWSPAPGAESPADDLEELWAVSP